MTAKEYIKNYGSDYESEGAMFLFTADELIKFIGNYAIMKCKEQREECADYIRLWYDDKEIIRDIIRDILNTPLPNIFEEAK